MALKESSSQSLEIYFDWNSKMATKEAPLGAVKRQTLADVAEKKGVDMKDVNTDWKQFQYKHEDLRCRYVKRFN